jgi:hypothetical protein
VLGAIPEYGRRRGGDERARGETPHLRSSNGGRS